MMTDEVRERRFAPFVRLEANESMDSDMLAILMREMKLVQVSAPFLQLSVGRKESAQRAFPKSMVAD
jgi:polyphosphate kinase